MVGAKWWCYYSDPLKSRLNILNCNGGKWREVASVIQRNDPTTDFVLFLLFLAKLWCLVSFGTLRSVILGDPPGIPGKFNGTNSVQRQVT